MKFYCYIAAVLFLLLALTGCGRYSGRPQPAVRGGVLDLTGWDFEKDGPVSLDGEWEFYWMKLYGPEDFKNGRGPGQPVMVKVPAKWTSYSDIKVISSEGYATYRLRIKFRQPALMAMRAADINTACNIFVGGSKLYSIGKVGRTREEMIPSNRLGDFPFEASDDTDLIVQVSNFDDNISGIVHSNTIGTYTQIRDKVKHQVAFDLFVFGSLLLIGLYHITLFILRRRDKAPLYFGIFCIIIALRSIMTGGRFLGTLIPGMPWDLYVRLECLTLVCAAFFALFLRVLYPYEFPKKAIAAFNVVTLLYTIVVIATPVYVFGSLLFVYQLAIVIMSTYAIGSLIIAVIRQREGAIFLLGGFAVFFLIVINDILHSQLVIQTAYLIPLGLIIFVFALSFVISLKYSRAFESIEIFSKELEEYALDLEDMIEDRTRELEIERNNLKTRNEIMEEQLMMAKRIQQQMIPSVSPVDFIHTLYKPLDHVGGDFFDFMQFRDNGKIGIFLSDVSGHGVPAAFITSMIKSLLLQMGRDRENPATLLSSLNEMLQNQTGGHFVTAFYGIFDREKKSLIYAVAGHNMPYVIDGDNTYRLEGKKGIPLAIMNAEEQGEKGKEYVNNEIQFCSDRSQSCKLVLYTDGLVETVNLNDTSQVFDETVLTTVLNEIGGLKSREFVQELFQRLIQFRGSGHFEDDICLICLEI